MISLSHIISSSSPSSKLSVDKLFIIFILLTISKIFWICDPIFFENGDKNRFSKRRICFPDQILWYKLWKYLWTNKNAYYKGDALRTWSWFRWFLFNFFFIFLKSWWITLTDKMKISGCLFGSLYIFFIRTYEHYKNAYEMPNIC